MQPTTKLSEAMSRSMEDMTNSTHRNANRTLPTFRSLFLFVTSIARTNLEAEIIQRGGTLCSNNVVRYKPKREYLSKNSIMFLISDEYNKNLLFLQFHCFNFSQCIYGSWLSGRCGDHSPHCVAFQVTTIHQFLLIVKKRFPAFWLTRLH